jgi:hypothetical protein
MKITVSRAINGISINGDEYVLDDDGLVMAFESVSEWINFLANRSWTIEDLRELHWHFEEATNG